MASRGNNKKQEARTSHKKTANGCSSHEEDYYQEKEERVILPETNIPTFTAKVPELKKKTSYWQIGTASLTRVKINTLRSDVEIRPAEMTIEGMFSELYAEVDVIGTAVIHIFGIPVEVYVTRSMMCAPIVADGILGSDFLSKHSTVLSLGDPGWLELCNSKVISPLRPAREIKPDYMELLHRQLAKNSAALANSPWSLGSKQLRKLQRYLPPQVTTDDRLQVIETLDEYADCFYIPGQKLGATKLLTYGIKTKDTRVIAKEQPEMSPDQWDELDRQLIKLLDQGVINITLSPYNSPVTLVEKKPNSKGVVDFRLAVDYRELNGRCEGDAFPIPDIIDLIDQLHGAKIFTVLDLASASHQIPLEPKDREKTAFTSHRCRYEFLRMPAGIKNASQNVQRLMCFALNTVLNSKHGVFVCHDDILIHAATPSEHEIRVRKVLSLLRDAGLKLQPDKCQLFRASVRYLGHVVTDEGLRPNPAKVEKAKNQPRPETVTSLRQHLGLLNYFARFIPNYSARARPMTNLLKGNGESLTWTSAAVRSYDDLTTELSKDWLLRYPDWKREFILETSSSPLGIHAALKQRQSDGAEPSPIAYASRCYTPGEAKEDGWYQHRLAAIYGMETFYWYFDEFVGKKFTLKTPEPKAFDWYRKHERHNSVILKTFERTYRGKKFNIERLTAVH